jgi:hypothetical protein
MRNLIKISALIILFQVFSGCTSEESHVPLWSHAYRYIPIIQDLKCFDAKIIGDGEDYSSDYREDINGTWQLLLDFSTGDTIDRSCESIFYSFRLIKDEQTGLFSREATIPEGTFKCEFSGDEFCPLCLPPPDPDPNLVIGEYMYFCQVAESWMTLFTVNYYGEERVRRRGDIEKIFYRIK